MDELICDAGTQGRPWYGSTGILEQWFDYLTGDPETLTSTVQPLPGATQL